MSSAVVWGILYVRAAELLAKAVVPGRGWMFLCDACKSIGRDSLQSWGFPN